MTVDPVDVADGDRGEVDLRTRVSRVPEDVRMSGCQDVRMSGCQDVSPHLWLVADVGGGGDGVVEVLLYSLEYSLKCQSSQT